MKKVITMAAIAISLIACKKTASNNQQQEPTEVVVTASIYPANSISVIGGKRYFVNIKASYPIGTSTTLYGSFNNPYYNNGKVNIQVKMPVFVKDTTVETNQPVSSSSLQHSNWSVDSIKGYSKYVLKF